MPAVAIHCPLCAGLIQIDSSSAGQQVNCPLCQGLLELPAEAELFAAPPPELPPALPAGGYPASTGPELLQLACPICGGGFQVPPEMAGQQVGCPHCNNVVTLPPLGPEPSEVSNLLPPGAMPAPAAVAPAREERPPPSVAASSEVPPATPQRKERSPDRARRERREKTPPRVDDMLPPGAAASSPEIDSLLPPGASVGATPVPAAEVPAPQRTIADTLLPPGAQAADASGTGGQQVALPKAPIPLKKPPANLPPGAAVVPMPDGGYVTVQEEKTKIITAGNQQIEIRKLSPEEKAARRRRNNLILGAFCLVILFIVFLILMNI